MLQTADLQKQRDQYFNIIFYWYIMIIKIQFYFYCIFCFISYIYLIFNYVINIIIIIKLIT